MNTLPKDVLNIIYSHFNTRELIKLREVSNGWKNSVEEIMGPNTIYCNNKLCDEHMYILRNAKNIYMKLCRQVTDVGMSKLEKVERLNASGCFKLTDLAFNTPNNIIDINLSGCYLLTDKVLGLLSRVKYIDLSYCNKITTEGLKSLTNNPTVVVKECPLISKDLDQLPITVSIESDERVLHDKWEYKSTRSNDYNHDKIKTLDRQEAMKYDNARCILFNKIYATLATERDTQFMKNYKSLLPNLKLLDYPEAIRRLQNIPGVKQLVDNLRLCRVDTLIAGSTALSCVYKDATFKPNDLDLYVKDINKEKLCAIEQCIYKTYEFCTIVVVRGAVTMTWYIQEKNSNIVKIQVNLLKIAAWPEILVTCHTDLTCIGFEIKSREFIYMEGRWNRLLTEPVHYFTNILNMDNQRAIYYSTLKYASRGFTCSMSPMYRRDINRIDEFKSVYFGIRTGHMSDTPRENINSNSMLDNLEKYASFINEVKFSSTVDHLFGNETPIPVLCLSVTKVHEYATLHPNDAVFKNNLVHARRYLNLQDVPPLPYGKISRGQPYTVGIQCTTCDRYCSIPSCFGYYDDKDNCEHILERDVIPEIILI